MADMRIGDRKMRIGDLIMYGKFTPRNEPELPDADTIADIAGGLQRFSKKYANSLSHERIMRIAASKGRFHVGVRYRDERAEKLCLALKKKGILHGGRHAHYGDGSSFALSSLGRAVLAHWAQSDTARRERNANG